MNSETLEIEREQLIGCWRRLVEKPNWRHRFETKIQQLGDAPTVPRIRSIHNDFGFRANDESRNGKCAGTIFRTELFIKTEKRIGGKTKKEPKSIHLEHIVPANVLKNELKNRSFLPIHERADFLLKHSVVTALHNKEPSDGTFKGCSRSTNSFDKSHPEYDRPFLRYRRLFDKGGVVWNVFDKIKIDEEEFTFDHHYDVVRRLLEHCSHLAAQDAK